MLCDMMSASTARIILPWTASRSSAQEPLIRRQQELPSACLDVDAVPVASGLERYHLHVVQCAENAAVSGKKEGHEALQSATWHREIVRCVIEVGDHLFHFFAKESRAGRNTDRLLLKRPLEREQDRAW